MSSSSPVQHAEQYATSPQNVLLDGDGSAHVAGYPQYYHPPPAGSSATTSTGPHQPVYPPSYPHNGQHTMFIPGQNQNQQPQQQPIMYFPLPFAVQATKPKRQQVRNACTNCQNACKRCDSVRPCGRCQKFGLADSCADSERKKRVIGSKRGSYKRGEKGESTEEPEEEEQQSQPASYNPYHTPHTFAGPHLIPIYGYSPTSGLPLTSDGQQIQFGTHYPYPIQYIMVPPPEQLMMPYYQGQQPQQTHQQQQQAHDDEELVENELSREDSSPVAEHGEHESDKNDTSEEMEEIIDSA
jgi:hypothetical protein